jgi:hypothetical protein
MSFQQIQVNQATALVLVLEDGASDQYPQAEIYAPGSAVPSNVLDMSHLAKGRYEASWTPLATGEYIVLYLTYSDLGHTSVNTKYSRELDKLSAIDSDTVLANIIQMLLRILGLSQENTFRDNTTFDQCGQLLTARIRIFDSKANCDAATDGGSETTGLIATYTMTAVFEGTNKLKTYKVVREP